MLIADARKQLGQAVSYGPALGQTDYAPGEFIIGLIGGADVTFALEALQDMFPDLGLFEKMRMTDAGPMVVGFDEGAVGIFEAIAKAQTHPLVAYAEPNYYSYISTMPGEWPEEEPKFEEVDGAPTERVSSIGPIAAGTDADPTAALVVGGLAAAGVALYALFG